MGTWGAGNFDNDGAKDYMDEVIAKFSLDIENCLLDKTRSAIDEDGEAILMPNVAIITVLCQHCEVAPPKLERIRNWKQSYLEIYDAQADDLFFKSEAKDARRLVIEKTFQELEALARA